MTGHVEALWLTYRERVLPADAGPIQVMETKRAFFAGALSLLNATLGSMFDDGNEPTEGDMRRMAEIDDELRAFGRSGGRI